MVEFAKTSTRKELIEDLQLRLSNLRRNSSPNNPEIKVLSMALNLERRVQESGREELSDVFSTGYAGRKGIEWEFSYGAWFGTLFNRQSGKNKKDGCGRTAEEMLRQLMPSRR